ncbi:MAG: hypothetical protein WCI67_14345 [Chloroflexales bacterium]
MAERYRAQRQWLGLVGASAPLFLVNGNHEQAALVNLDGTPDNTAAYKFVFAHHSDFSFHISALSFPHQSPIFIASL